MTEPLPLHIARYLLGIVAGFVLMFGLAWTYIATFPMTFLPSGYPVWVAKKHMLDHCDLGEIMEFGDSLLEAAIVSHGLPLVSTNFSAGGVSPLEGYFLVQKALTCPHYPKRVILVFGVGDFLSLQEAFWANMVRFGIIGADAIDEITDTARRLNDSSFDDYITGDGLSGWRRNVIYDHHLPPIYFDSLVSGGFFLRATSNRALYADALARRGQMPYRGLQVQAADPPNRNKPPPLGFHPLRIQTEYFERMVTELTQAGVSIDFIMTPVTPTRAAWLHANNLERDFVSFLRDIERQYPNFHLSQSAAPIWPVREFVDGTHLHPEGAARFTQLLNSCLRMTSADWQSGTYTRSCDFESEPATTELGPAPAR
jgi:hypothetical protein